jgi:hypothetical protein
MCSRFHRAWQLHLFPTGFKAILKAANVSLTLSTGYTPTGSGGRYPRTAKLGIVYGVAR